MSALWPNGQNYPGDVWHEFGPRAPIWTPNGPTSSFHSGIDIGPWSGTQSTWLLSPVDGVVIHAGYDSIFGNRVVVRGGGADFWLCHGRTGFTQVVAGQQVSQGQRLMLMGETGKASGVHIHFEVHVNGTRVDPRAYYASPAASGAGGVGGFLMSLTPDEQTELLRRVRNLDSQVTGADGQDPSTTGRVIKIESQVNGLPDALSAIMLQVNGVPEVLADIRSRVGVSDAQVRVIADAIAAQIGTPTLSLDYVAIAEAVNDDTAKRLAD